MGKGRIIGAPSFRALESAFVEELTSASRGPGDSVWVLVPTNLLALHLRRQAARRTGGVMGVEFLTLNDAARRMVRIHLATQGKRPVPAGAIGLVLEGFLTTCPDGTYLASFRRFGNGPSAINRAIQLLTNCLWTPEALRQAAGVAAFRDGTTPGRLRELADIWSQLLDWKAEQGLFDADDLVLEAGRRDVEPAEHPDLCFLYGFYDFMPAQRALVERVISVVRTCSAYLLWMEKGTEPAPGFGYALPTVRWLQEILSAATVECLEGGGSGSDLDRLVDGVFAEHLLVSDEEARGRLKGGSGWDGTVRVVSCPGETAEAAEVAREVLRAADERREEGQGGVNGVSVGVLLRGVEQAAGRLAEVFDRTGIRYSIREGVPLAETVAGRVALKLLELAAGDAERADVVDFLAMAEIRWPEGLSATAVDRVSRQAGVTGGRANWTGRLAARAEQFLAESQRTEDEQERRALVRDGELCQVAAGFLGEFFEKIRLLSASSWADAARKLHSLVQEYAPADDAGTDPVLEVVAGLASLDVTGTRPDSGRLRRVMGRLLAEQSLKLERFQHVGVCVSSIMGLRGVTFDLVVVPGLVEKNFPRHIPAGSLLTEWDREALNAFAQEAGCAVLPPQSDRPLEERYLFRLALGSARRAVVLTYPRLEQDRGRPKMASRFLTDACSALAGFGVGAPLLDEGLPAGLVQRVPLNRRTWSAEELRLALDTLEYDGAVFGGAGGGAGRSAYMAAVCPFFGRALRMERQRWGRADFGPYDGKIRAEDLLQSLREEYSRFGSPISPTRFETYAECPFRYFLTHVLGIDEVEAPSEELQLPPRERGSLVHELLRRLYQERLGERPLGSLSEADIGAALARASEVLDELGRVHAENHPATWMAEREKTMRELKALLTHEREAHGEAAPAMFEFELDSSSPDGYVCRLGRGMAVAFRGRIDRVDRLPDGAIGVVDYKTGRSQRFKENRLLGGRQLQLPIYLLAAGKLLNAGSGAARYLFVSEPKDVPQFSLAQLKERMADFRKALRMIVGGIAAGNFFPLPVQGPRGGERCPGFCEYTIVCGAARNYLAEMKQTDPETRQLNELRDID